MNCDQANKLPICAVAEALGFKLKPLRNNEYQVKEDTSLVLNAEKNVFHQFGATGKSGGVVNMVQILMRTTSISDVLKSVENLHLTSLEGKVYSHSSTENKGVEWPKKIDNDGEMKAYLQSERGLDEKLVEALIKSKWIYESSNNFAVFVERNLDTGKAVGYEARATCEKNVKHLVSPRGDGMFWIGNNFEPTELYLFESAIDLLSFIMLYKRTENGLYASCRSINNINYFTGLITKKYCSIKDIYCCFDRDSAGYEGYKNVDKYNDENNNIYNVIYNSPNTKKDWNEVLVSLKNHI